MSGFAIAGVAAGYGGRAVLRDVDISGLRAGALTALIGPNAAGKSTLLKTIAGLIAPMAGTITLNRRDLVGVGLTERARSVRFVPQVTATQARLTVFDLLLVARMSGAGRRATAEDIAAAEQALARVGIVHLADRFACDLSGGQQQLVALAQALTRPAEVYLLDEPTSSLDLRNQLEAIAILRSVAHRDGVVVVAALHDLNLAARHADHLVLLAEGRVVLEGPPDGVLADPRCAAAYGVSLATARTARGGMLVEAYLP